MRRCATSIDTKISDWGWQSACRFRIVGNKARAGLPDGFRHDRSARFPSDGHQNWRINGDRESVESKSLINPRYQIEARRAVLMEAAMIQRVLVSAIMAASLSLENKPFATIWSTTNRVPGSAFAVLASA